MSYLLDTNACIALLRGTSAPLERRIRAAAPRHIHLCAVVVAELLLGARKSGSPERSSRIVEEFIAPFDSHPFDDAAARYYADIRSRLEAEGRSIGGNDLLIAATARAHDLVLVTHNTREFERVPDLVLEDWEID